MVSNWPSALDSFTDPVAGQPADNPSQAGAVTALNNAVEAMQADLGIQAGSRRMGFETSFKSASYTLALADAGTCVEVSSVSATTITVPTNASVAFPVGTVIVVRRANVGTVEVVGDVDVNILSPGGATFLADRWSEARLVKRATNGWVMNGDIST